MAANFATRPQCHLCCTHTHWQRCQLLATLENQGGHFLATLPTFGNLATAWSISADRSWQRQLPLRSDAIGTNRYLMLYPLSAFRPLPTARCLLPSAHCPLPTALAAVCTRLSQATPPSPPSQGGERGGGVAAARVQQLFQNGDWPICLVGPVPVLKQLLNAGRNWRRAYRGRRCCVGLAEPLADVGGACLAQRKWGQLGLFLNEQFGMSAFRVFPYQSRRIG